MAYALDGFAHAAEALIGGSLGAKNKRLLQQSIKTTALWSLVIALFFTLFGFPLKPVQPVISTGHA